MPLRSVEAATRDDAIAAAREQFGPQARVVGVRRVRSGGVLGFFATERYVAEVAPDCRPARPSRPSRRAPCRRRRPADFSSPLASAAPARARATAPARNGAAAWAAEAARSPTTAARAAERAASSGRTPTARARPPPARSAGRPPARRRGRTGRRPADDDRVSELAGLLGRPAGRARRPPPTPAPRSRAPPSRARAPSRRARRRHARSTTTTTTRPASVPASPAAPSPFTAALARMVAGDRDVRQAVEDALDRAGGGASRAPMPSPRPVRPEPVATAESSVPPPAARQEEETVGDQVIAPPSTHGLDRWRCPPGPPSPRSTAASVSSREEAIAEVLRSALAQGHSDEALAGILRKVLAGASPQTALTEPDAAAAGRRRAVVPSRPTCPVTSRSRPSRRRRRRPTPVVAPSPTSSPAVDDRAPAPSRSRPRRPAAPVEVAAPEPPSTARSAPEPVVPVARGAGRRAAPSCESPRRPRPVVPAPRPRCGIVRAGRPLVGAGTPPWSGRRPRARPGDEAVARVWCSSDALVASPPTTAASTPPPCWAEVVVADLRRRPPPRIDAPGRGRRGRRSSRPPSSPRLAESSRTPRSRTPSPRSPQPRRSRRRGDRGRGRRRGRRGAVVEEHRARRELAEELGAAAGPHRQRPGADDVARRDDGHAAALAAPAAAGLPWSRPSAGAAGAVRAPLRPARVGPPPSRAGRPPPSSRGVGADRR